MSDEHCKGLCDVDSESGFCFGCHRSLEERLKGDPSPLSSGELHEEFEEFDLLDECDQLDDLNTSDIDIN